MKLTRSALADLSEIISSVAILITLVYLTIEINQNTSALNAQSREAVLVAAQSELQLMLDRPHLIQNLTGSQPLTEAEQLELDSMLTITLRAREFSWLQYQDSTIDDLQWDTEFLVLLSLLDSDRSRMWWEKMGRQVFGERFVAFVDEALETNPATNQLLQTAGSWANPDG